MQRIVVIGTTASGKSTLARRLAAKLNLPYYDMDDFHWQPGWQENSLEEFRRRATEATAGDTWVMSGNYSKARDIIWARADTVVWLDLPMLENLWSLFRRTVRRIWSGEMICNGNYETFGKQFLSGGSLFPWFFKTWGPNRARYRAIVENPGEFAHITFIRLTSHRHADEWLKILK